jgi:hypothetical protein
MKNFSDRRRKSGLLIVLLVGLLCAVKIGVGLARTTGQEKTASSPPWKVKKVATRRLGVKSRPPNLPASPERVIEDQVPAHLPLKIEINNLQVEPLLRNLEIKVTNISEKAIYFLELDLVLPDVLSPSGHPISFPLRYGRTRLIDFQEPLRSEDVPIQPGESFSFKIPAKNLGAFERLAARMNLPQSAIKTVYLLFQQINFGDKTGFSTSGGLPVPTPLKGKNSNDSCVDGREGKVSLNLANAQLTLSPDTFHSHLAAPSSYKSK